jgi:prevent-host-death family protein
MADKTVGIRELKARLSGYIQHVKNGHTVVITERGRPVGRMTPAYLSVEERIQNVVRSGVVAWSGRSLKPARTVARLKHGATTVADIVVENRD